MQGTVNEIGRTQKGTPKLKIDGKWYLASRVNLDGIETGSQVEFEPGKIPNTTIDCVNFLKLVAPARNGYGSPEKPNPALSDDAELRFISNCVGQAIAAGTIKEPHQIAPWFAAAKAALRQPTADNLDDPGFDPDDGRF